MSIRRLRLGDRQVDALQLWVFDPAHIEFAEDFPDEAHPGSLMLQGSYLVFDESDAKAVWRHLIDAANSADESAEHATGDARAEFRTDRDVITSVVRRIRW